MISYKPLLKLLIDKNLKKINLVSAGVLSSATMAKIDKGEYISFSVLDKLCGYLKCQPSDILKHITEDNNYNNDII